MDVNASYKTITFAVVAENIRLSQRVNLLKFKLNAQPPLSILPGQFVQVKTENRGAFLRRPLSVHRYDASSGILQLMVANVGRATEWVCNLEKGSKVDIVVPLGNTFDLQLNGVRSVLLIGGGIGIAPLLYYGEWLHENTGIEFSFLLGGRTAKDILLKDEYRAVAPVYCSTEDGSVGERGLVTENKILSRAFDRWAVCGPMPMMRALSDLAARRGVKCEVSLENTMACGLGACLCCVQKTNAGNKCVCTEGPVFDSAEIVW